MKTDDLFSAKHLKAIGLILILLIIVLWVKDYNRYDGGLSGSGYFYVIDKQTGNLYLYKDDVQYKWNPHREKMNADTIKFIDETLK